MSNIMPDRPDLYICCTSIRTSTPRARADDIKVYELKERERKTAAEPPGRVGQLRHEHVHSNKEE